MGTTINLDDDVAAELNRIREARNISLSEAANETLRNAIAKPTESKPSKPLTMKSFDVGRLLVDITCTSEALAIAEGEDYR